MTDYRMAHKGKKPVKEKEKEGKAAPASAPKTIPSKK